MIYISTSNAQLKRNLTSFMKFFFFVCEHDDVKKKNRIFLIFNYIVRRNK